MKKNTLYQYEETFFKFFKVVNSLVYDIEFYDKEMKYLHTDYARRIIDIKTTYKGAKKANLLLNP